MKSLYVEEAPGYLMDQLNGDVKALEFEAIEY